MHGVGAWCDAQQQLVGATGAEEGLGPSWRVELGAFTLGDLCLCCIISGSVMICTYRFVV